MKVTTTSERLNFLLKERNLKQVDILNLAEPYCKKFGVTLTKVDLSQYISGKYEPKQVKLNILALALNVNEAWLMGYDVPMQRNNNNDAPSQMANGIDPDLVVLERAKDKMSDNEWQKLMNAIKAFYPQFFE